MTAPGSAGCEQQGKCQRHWGWGELKHCEGCRSIGLGQRAPVAGDCGSGCGTAAVTLNEWGPSPLLLCSPADVPWHPSF